MRKNYLLIIILLSSLCSAQVGIGTTSPNEELHIAGANSTIRIEKLNSINSSGENDGIKPAFTYVDFSGDITISNGSGGNGNSGPFNFLIDLHNFVDDNPYNYSVPDEINTTGIVINNNTSQSYVEGEITNISFTVPQDALIEVKYGITLYVKGEDMSANPPPYIDVDYGQAINMVAYFRIDINSDGLTGSEMSKIYGKKGQYYETLVGGIAGFPYMNGQGYLTIPKGTHKIIFYGVINDNGSSYTSVGFGGLPDYLKIRIYN